MSDSEKRRQGFSRVFIFTLLLVWGTVGAIAQETDPAPDPAAETAEPAPPPIKELSLSEVASEAERTSAEIFELKALTAPKENVIAARDQLLALESTCTELEERPAQIDPGASSWSELESIQRQWKRLAAKLKDTESVVGERSRMLEGRAGGIARSKEVWTRTRKVLLDQKSPDAVIERVDSVLRDLAEIDGALKARQAELFTLQDRIASDRIRVTQAMEELISATSKVRRNLFARTDPPLWQAMPTDDEGPSLGEQWTSSLRRKRLDLDELAQDFRTELTLHVLFTVVLMLVLARLKKRAGGWTGDENDLKAAAAVLSRPLAAGYVVSATLTIVLYVDAPDPIYRIAYLTATVPLLLLVRAIVPEAWRLPLYGPIGLFALLHLGRLVPGFPLFQRALFLVLALAAAIGLAVIQRRNRAKKRMEAGPLWRAAVITCRVALVLLAFAIVGNVLGMFELTILLTLGLFNSAYFALATVISVLILDGAVAISLETETLRTLRMIRYHPQAIRQRVSRVIHIAGVVMWAWVTLVVYDLWPLIRGWFVALLGREWTAGKLEFSLGGLLTFIFTIWISVKVSRFVRFALEQDVYPRVQLARGLPGTISMLVRYSIMTIGFLVAVAAAGFPLSNFALLAGALGVGIGFGLQNVVNNFVSGLILAFERPIQIGDTIEVGQILGVVRAIGIRASNVRTFDGAEVIVPNGDLISAQVINWTLSDRRRRIRLPVGVTYGTDPQRVIDLLTETAGQHEDVMSDPAPRVLFNGFGDSSLDFEMRFWTRAHDRYLRIRSEVAVAVNVALKEAGIEIPFPQRDLHVRSVDADAARSLGGDTIEKVPAPSKKPAGGEKDD